MWIKFSIHVRKFSLDENSIDKTYSASHQHLWHFVNILSLFQSSVLYIDRDPLWVFPIIDEKLGSGKGDFSQINEVNFNEHFYLDTNDFEDFKNFFQRCFDYFSNEIRSDLDKFIFNAYHWLHKTRTTMMPYDRLIFLSILLESLAGTGSEIVHRISHRCAVIVGENGTQCGEIYDMIKGYYKKRSSLVHGDRSIISTNELYNLTEIARVMILKFASLSIENVGTTRNDINDKFDRAVVDDTLRNELQAKANSIFINRSNPKLR